MIDFGKVATFIAKKGLKAMGMGLGGMVIGAIMDKGLDALEGHSASIPTDAIKPDDPVIETEAKDVAETETATEVPTEPEVETETPTEQEVEA